MKMLFVCEGNTCRSPMASGLARQILKRDVMVESCGLETTNGLGANAKAIAVMKEIRAEIEHHSTKDIADVRCDEFDVIIALTPEIASKLRGKVIDRTKIRCLDVRDPYGGDLPDYRQARDEIARQLTVLFGE